MCGYQPGRAVRDRVDKYSDYSDKGRNVVIIISLKQTVLANRKHSATARSTCVHDART